MPGFFGVLQAKNIQKGTENLRFVLSTNVFVIRKVILELIYSTLGVINPRLFTRTTRFQLHRVHRHPGNRGEKSELGDIVDSFLSILKMFWPKPFRSYKQSQDIASNDINKRKHF